MRCDDLTRLAFGAGCGFDFNVQRVTIGAAKPRCVFQCLQRLTGVSPGMPAAGIKLGQCLPELASADVMTAGGAFQRGVVHQKRHAVGAEFGIALKHAVAMLRAQSEGGEGVFGG